MSPILASTLIKPQITFNPDLEHIPFDTLMMNFTESIEYGTHYVHSAEKTTFSMHFFTIKKFKVPRVL